MECSSEAMEILRDIRVALWLIWLAVFLLLFKAITWYSGSK